MKTDIFYWILNMSLQGGLVCLIVLLLRKLPKLPRQFSYALWLLPLFRLTIPFGIESPLSLLGRLAAKHVYLPIEPEYEQFLPALNCIGAADSYFPIIYKSIQLNRLFSLATPIWIVGAALCVAAALILYYRSRKEIFEAQPHKDWYVSEGVNSPVLLGIFKPKIVVPPGIPDEDMADILRHERIHIRRLDNLWRFMAVLVCCVHWFNPVCWLCLKYFFADMELSCDEAAIRNLDKPQRKHYANTLLNTASRRSLFASAFGGAKLGDRIQNILSYKRLTFAASIALVILFAAIAVILNTN